MTKTTKNVGDLTNEQRAKLESWLMQFDTAWNRGLIKKYANEIPTALAEFSNICFLELAKVDLDRRWSDGERIPVEDYLREFPELGSVETIPVDFLLTEYIARKSAGERNVSKVLFRRFPHRAAELKQLLQRERPGESISRRVSQARDTKTGKSDTQSVPPKSVASPGRQTQLESTAGVRSGTIPPSFGRYRILRQLGRGAMGAVYLAEDSQLKRQIALKTPSFTGGDSAELVDRFYREAHAAANLRHANICPVYDVGEFEGRHFITMAYIEGRLLSDFIKPDDPMPERSAAVLIRRLAIALQFAHQAGIVHRDLKPANIMIDRQKEPIIMDFGLARKLDSTDESRATQQGMILGTPAYMSLEQVEGDLDAGPQSDIYSLGVILYELLTGRLPYEGTVTSIIGQILVNDPPRPSEHRDGLDPALEAICLKMMARKREDRFATMAEAAEALTGYLKEEKTEVDGQPFWKTLQNRVGKTPPLWRWSALAGLAAVIVLSVVLLFRRPDGSTLRIEVDDPNLVVMLDGDQLTLTDKAWQGKKKDEKHKLAVKVGDQALTIGSPTTVTLNDGRTVTHKLTLKVNGAELSSDSFEIVRGEMTVVKIIYQKVVAVAPKKQSPTTVAKRQPDSGFGTKLFDGKTMDGWEAYPEVWSVKDGMIIGNRIGNSSVWTGKNILWSKSEFADFRLRFQCRPNVTSYLLLRGILGAKKLYGGGYSIALCENPKMDLGTISVKNGATQEVIAKPTDAALKLEKDRSTGSIWKTFDVEARGNRIRVSVDGVHLAEVARDGFKRGRIGFYIARGRFELKEIEIQPLPTTIAKADRTLTGHTDIVSAVRFSRDGRFVISSSHDKTVKYWDASTGQCLKTFTGHTGSVRDVDISPDGTFAISGGGGGSVRRWALTNGTTDTSFSGPKKMVRAVAIHPNGKRAITGGDFGELYHWELETAKPSRPRGVGSSSVFAVAYSANGKFAATGGYKKTPILWDAEKMTLLNRMPVTTESINAVSVSNDGRRMLVSSGLGKGHMTQLYDTQDGKVLAQWPDVIHATMSPDGTRALAAQNSNSVVLLDLKPSLETKTVQQFRHRVTSVAFSADGKMGVFGLATGEIQVKLLPSFPSPVADPAKTSPTLTQNPKPVTKPIDLLAQIPAADLRLINPNGKRKLRIEGDNPIPVTAYAPPEEYDLHVTIQRFEIPNGKADRGFSVRLAIGNETRKCGVYIDGQYGSGINNLDGKDYRKNETYKRYSKQKITSGSEHSLIYRIRKNSVSVDLDGKTLIDWMGRITRFPLAPDGKRLIGFGAHNARFVISKAVVIPIPNKRDVAVKTLLQAGATITVLKDAQEIDVDSFEKLPAVPFVVDRVWLKKSRNLTDDIVAGIANFDNVRELLLDKNGTGMTNDRLKHLSGLKNLQKLIIGRNSIGDEGMKHLSRLYNLEVLSLRRTGVRGDGLKDLAGLKKLNYLTLYRSAMTDAGLKHLANLQSLSTLYLADTSVTGRDLSVLTKLPSLQKLSLGGTDFDAKSADLKSLKKRTGLKLLWLSRGTLTQSELEHWKKELPGVRIATGEPADDESEDPDSTSKKLEVIKPDSNANWINFQPAELEKLNARGLTFKGPGDDVNLIGNYRATGGWVVHGPTLLSSNDKQSALRVGRMRDFELEGTVTLNQTGGWFIQFGDKGRQGYLLYNVVLRTSAIWSLFERPNEKFGNEKGLSKLRLTGMQSFRLRVADNRITFQIGKTTIADRVQIPKYDGGDIYLGTARTQYGPMKLRIHSLRLRMLNGSYKTSKTITPSKMAITKPKSATAMAIAEIKQKLIDHVNAGKVGNPPNQKKVDAFVNAELAAVKRAGKLPMNLFLKLRVKVNMAGKVLSVGVGIGAGGGGGR